ncbi:putative U3 small nucleolar RNA-associated protein 7 [Friedmanniomyces endolithicus]|uniref:U3 small nucleolar RNA-associated protein 7 n=1 Tax=Rachicladosporium monterosium TaxID=1507873 RepID=A0ABR0L8W8_9PEZI|nr:putative U3 small nucleolar RNA-associated protein 7 [Friedmanniomyces endolithicus]KAK5144794.1 putative U3 small nucleolar RNA-associated protein 7 [Rachicladosporium monterosium]
MPKAARWNSRTEVFRDFFEVDFDIEKLSGIHELSKHGGAVKSMAGLETTDLVKANGQVRAQRKGPPTAQLSVEDAAAKKRQEEASRKYGRGKGIELKNVKDRKARGTLKALEERYKESALKAKEAEILLEHDSGFLEPEGELERTYKVRQDAIQKDVGVETAKKGFELKLEGMGPYTCDYTRNGRDLLLAGRKGHVATMDWRSGKLGCELQLGETVRDAKWLHNNQYFAVAQKRNVYIYDHHGVEIHALDSLSPYMAWGGEGQHIERVRWCPFEDVLGVGHDKGYSSLLVPGAGEPNFDALEANPYENAKGRQEAEVKALLNKLQPEMISLDPDFVGKLDTVSNQQRQVERDLDRKTGVEAERERVEKLRNRGRGKNSSLRKFLRKKGNQNVVDEHKMRVIEMREEQRKRAKEAKEGRKGVELGPALARFGRKGG